MEGSDQQRGRTVRALVVQALGGRELAHVSLGLILLVFVALPVAHALRCGSVFPIVFGFGLVLVVSRIRLTDRAGLIAIGVCFALVLAIQIFILANHRVEPVSDFRTQWNAAIEYAENGLGIIDRPQTQRAIPFYYPLILLFGKSPTVYLVSNAVLTSLTFLMSVWIARRSFGWPAAAKTAMLLLFAFEPVFANTFPSHDIFGSFGVVLFLCLLVEIEVIVSRVGRSAVAIGLALMMSLAITWVEWQRTMGLFCIAALLFYGLAAVVQRAPRARLRIAIVIGVITLSTLQSCGLKSCGLVATPPPKDPVSTEMNLLVFGTDEGDAQFADWLRNSRMAEALESDQVARLGKLEVVETLRRAPGKKYENFLDRELSYLRTGKDTGWYLTIQSPRWLSENQIRAIYQVAMKWTPSIWWAIAILMVTAAMFRREVLFDVRTAPLILIGSFMAVMGLFGEIQSRYAMFMVFLWPIYAGSPFVANPLPGLKRGLDGMSRRTISLAVARVAISAAVVIAIPIAIVMLAPHLFDDSLANLEHATVIVGPSSTGSHGVPPNTTAVRNLLTVSDAALGSENMTLTITDSIEAKQDDSTLRFVVDNELGEPVDRDHPSAQPAILPGRALRVIVDGSLHRTIDLAMPVSPRAFEIPGFAKGAHDVRLELDIGASHIPPKQKCSHRWKSPEACTNTSIGYLGFY